MDLSLTQTYYDVHAEEYFEATRNLDLTRMWRKLLACVEADAHVLDLGCGSGRDVAYFASKGLRPVGLDSSLPLLTLAKSLTNQPLVVADFARMPFKNASFNAVWSIGSLVHVPKCQLSCVLAEVSRILEPGGVFLTSIKVGSGEKIDGLGRFVACYQTEEWRCILNEEGFDIVSMQMTGAIHEIAPNNIGRVQWIECQARKTFSRASIEKRGIS